MDNIRDIIVRQNTRQTNMLADKYFVLVVLNVTEVYNTKIKYDLYIYI